MKTSEAAGSTTNRVVKSILPGAFALLVLVSLVHQQNVSSTRKLHVQLPSASLPETLSLTAPSKPSGISTAALKHFLVFAAPAQAPEQGETLRTSTAVASVSETQRLKHRTQKKNKNSNANQQESRMKRGANKRNGNRTKKKQEQILTVKGADQTNLPPLTSLIGDTYENITGQVQNLLDFAIVGFGKCGTTALINWLDDHPEINTIPKEALHLSRQRPALMVQKLYQMKVESTLKHQETIETSRHVDDMDHSNNNATIVTGRIQGFKNPSDIRRPEAMIYLRQHWPQTKLIVTVRHPLHWFRSLYNFLLNEMGRSTKYLQHTSLLGGPHKNTAYAHTGKGEFHAILSLLGKTSMDTDEELDLLKGFLRTDEINDWPQRLPNKIFFLDTAQMSDTNETRAGLFRQDLQDFLGLKEPLPPVLHVRPGKDRQIDEALKLDMCQPEQDEVRQELMRISRKASVWFRKFFLESEDVVVSTREYLDEIFATTWMQDPCDPAPVSS